MVKHLIVAIGLCAGLAACEKKEAPTAAERAEAAKAQTEKINAEAAKDKAAAGVEVAKAKEEKAEDRLEAAKDHAEKTADKVDMDWKGPDEKWGEEWAKFADGKDRSVERDDYLIERDANGDLVAWRKTKQVAGDAFADLKDATLVTAVKAKLAADDDTRASTIDVDAADHIVTLRGNVRNAKEAGEAVRLALSTPGTDKVIARLSWKT